MKKKLIYFVPVFLIIISIITSFIAFSYTKKLENGYIYISDNTSEVSFDGEYFTILGNLGLESTYLSVESFDDYLLISIYDSNQLIIREYTFIIKEVSTQYSSDIINSYIGSSLVNIDNIDEYIFTVNLKENVIYDTELVKTVNNVDEEVIDLVLVNIPENLLNMKDINESISFTTLVFAALSAVTILAILYVKKDN